MLKGNKKYSTVNIFSNGSIGDFLMAIFIAENMYLDSDSSIECNIIVPRNKKIFDPLVVSYAYIKVLDIKTDNIIYYLPFMLKSFFSPSVVIVAYAFGAVSVTVKLFAKILASNFNSVLAGFVHKNFKGQSMYDLLVPFDFHMLVHENYINLLQKLGFTVYVDKPRLLNKKDSSAISCFLLTGKTYIVIHVAASNAKRTLPKERWRGVVDYIKKKYDNVFLVFSGSKEDRSFIETIIGDVSSNIINLAGEVSLKELSIIIDKSALYIGPDTGITHMASFLHKRSVVIGNMSNPTWLPYYNSNAFILVNRKNCICSGKKNSQCFYVLDGKEYYRCMIDIPQEEIYEAIDFSMK